MAGAAMGAQKKRPSEEEWSSYILIAKRNFYS